jgi:hypothetical protein
VGKVFQEIGMECAMILYQGDHNAFED